MYQAGIKMESMAFFLTMVGAQRNLTTESINNEDPTYYIIDIGYRRSDFDCEILMIMNCKIF